MDKSTYQPIPFHLFSHSFTHVTSKCLEIYSKEAEMQSWERLIWCLSLNCLLNASSRTLAAAKSLQSCPTLCDPIDGSPPGSPVPGILQARTLEWVAISFSNACKWKVKVKSLSRVRLLATPWTAAHQAPHPWDFPGKSTGVGCHCLLLPVLSNSQSQSHTQPWLLELQPGLWALNPAFI